MSLTSQQLHIVRAMAAGMFLRDLRDIEGRKSYALHPLQGAPQPVSGDDVHALVDAGWVSSNKKFPGATYWLTEKGRQNAAHNGAAFALIPSPLVGSATWVLVAQELARRGHLAFIANPLDDAAPGGKPFWQQHVESVAGYVNAANAAKRCWLVGHSGAGPLLPAIAARLIRPPAGMIFADAGIGRDGCSRLDLMRVEGANWVDAFEEELHLGGAFPMWTDADLASQIPSPDLRQQILAELRPRRLNYFTEKIDVPDRHLACGYLQFSPAYAHDAREAERRGWQVVQLNGGHFHMLADAPAVAQALLALSAQPAEKT